MWSIKISSGLVDKSHCCADDELCDFRQDCIDMAAGRSSDGDG